MPRISCSVLRDPAPAADVPFAGLVALYRHELLGVHNAKGVLGILSAILFAQCHNSRRATPQDAVVPLPVTDPRFFEELLGLNRGTCPSSSATCMRWSLCPTGGAVGPRQPGQSSS